MLRWTGSALTRLAGHSDLPLHWPCNDRINGRCHCPDERASGLRGGRAAGPRACARGRDWPIPPAGARTADTTRDMLAVLLVMLRVPQICERAMAAAAAAAARLVWRRAALPLVPPGRPLGARRGCWRSPRPGPVVNRASVTSAVCLHAATPDRGPVGDLEARGELAPPRRRPPPRPMLTPSSPGAGRPAVQSPRPCSRWSTIWSRPRRRISETPYVATGARRLAHRDGRS